MKKRLLIMSLFFSISICFSQKGNVKYSKKEIKVILDSLGPGKGIYVIRKKKVIHKYRAGLGNYYGTWIKWYRKKDIYSYEMSSIDSLQLSLLVDSLSKRVCKGGRKDGDTNSVNTSTKTDYIIYDFYCGPYDRGYIYYEKLRGTMLLLEFIKINHRPFANLFTRRRYS